MAKEPSIVLNAKLKKSVMDRNCKISGITVYAREDQRNPGGLQPYVDAVLDLFGPRRCVWGGDWPVVNLAAGLPAWCQITRQLLVGLAPDDLHAVMSDNAIRIYRL